MQEEEPPPMKSSVGQCPSMCKREGWGPGRSLRMRVESGPGAGGLHGLPPLELCLEGQGSLR